MFEPIKSNELKWIGVDFDGVLAELSHPPDYPMKGPQPLSRESVEEIVSLGLKPMIYTARHSADYLNLERWHNHYDIPIRRISTGKDLVKWLIDDKAIEFDPSRPEESWRRAMEIIRTGRLPW